MVAAGEGLRAGQAKVAAAVRQGHHDRVRRPHQPAGGRHARGPASYSGSATDHAAVGRKRAFDCALRDCPRSGQGSIPVRSAYNSAALLVTGSLPRVRMTSASIAGGRGPLSRAGTTRRQSRRVALPRAATPRSSSSAAGPRGRDASGVGDFHLIVGVMAHKEQDSSYDGRDIAKVFVPFADHPRDFPNKPPAARLGRPPAGSPARTSQQHEACKDEVRRRARPGSTTSTRATRRRPRIWDTVRRRRPSGR